MILTHCHIITNVGGQDFPSQIRLSHVNKRIILYVGSRSDTNAVHITCIETIRTLKTITLAYHVQIPEMNQQ